MGLLAANKKETKQHAIQVSPSLQSALRHKKSLNITKKKNKLLLKQRGGGVRIKTAYINGVASENGVAKCNGFSNLFRLHSRLAQSVI